MCGIVGWLAWDGLPDVQLVRQMMDRMVHRGPDAEGLAQEGPVVLGHRRLSVIDTRHSNDQPLYDRTGDYVIVFNGEIYNFRELRRTLESTGSSFKTDGDTEVILESYKAWGAECVERFVGMFALAIWDGPANRLFLARDRLGEKPLFYAEPAPGQLLFASEPRVLTLDRRIGRRVDPLGLAQYLAINYTLGERSLYCGIRRLPPATTMIVERDRAPAVRRYWDLAAKFRSKREGLTLALAAEEVREAVDRAVQGQMISDVPLGAFLSGGIDSATVVAAMTRARHTSHVRTFSTGFAHATFSELEQARETAQVLSVDHADETLDAGTEDIMASVVRAADEPLADGSFLPMYYLARFARSSVTVALSGDGGDECFGGYETYRADVLHGQLHGLPRWLLSMTHGIVDRYWPVSFSKVSFDFKLRRFLAGLRLPPARAHFSWRQIASRAELLELMQPSWAADVLAEDNDPFQAFAEHHEEVKDCHFLDQAMYVDMKTWLPDDILVKVDRATMAHSLEARAPFLDHRLVELAAQLPVHFKVRGRESKRILRLSQEARLPRRVLARRKQGFNAPLTQWLNGPLREPAREILNDRKLGEWFRPDAVNRLWQDQLAGRRDHGFKLFGLMCFGLWLNQT